MNMFLYFNNDTNFLYWNEQILIIVLPQLRIDSLSWGKTFIFQWVEYYDYHWLCILMILWIFLSCFFDDLYMIMPIYYLVFDLMVLIHSYHSCECFVSSWLRQDYQWDYWTLIQEFGGFIVTMFCDKIDKKGDCWCFRIDWQLCSNYAMVWYNYPQLLMFWSSSRASQALKL